MIDFIELGQIGNELPSLAVVKIRFWKHISSVEKGKSLNPYFMTSLRRSGFGSLNKTKQILLGKKIISHGLTYTRNPDGFESFSPTDLAIQYLDDNELVPFSVQFQLKPLIRYDFRNEWNNRGYGKISLDSSDQFGLSERIEMDGGIVIAQIIRIDSGAKICDYAWLKDEPETSTLWFNREVGPCDGYDWYIVEKFLTSYRSTKLNCLPSLSDVPWGYQGAFTMRIDCDEAIASGRELFEVYRSRGIPFSLAITTKQSINDVDRLFMAEVLAAGGSVVGHSHTHEPNWGGSRERAAWEVATSRRILQSLDIIGINYDYVVSPFHQNSVDVLLGLRDEKIRGFVGGIICNDPEFILARGGAVLGIEGIVSHSQQCMLHGETVNNEGGSIENYRMAFKQALESETFFGFLDHPFSQYWYGWKDEKQRCGIHEDFLDFILAHDGIWCANLVDTMRFMEMKSTAVIENIENGSGFVATLPFSERWQGLPSVRIRYKEDEFSLSPGQEVRIEV